MKINKQHVEQYNNSGMFTCSKEKNNTDGLKQYNEKLDLLIQESSYSITNLTLSANLMNCFINVQNITTQKSNDSIKTLIDNCSNIACASLLPALPETPMLYLLSSSYQYFHFFQELYNSSLPKNTPSMVKDILTPITTFAVIGANYYVSYYCSLPILIYSLSKSQCMESAAEFMLPSSVLKDFIFEKPILKHASLLATIGTIVAAAGFGLKDVISDEMNQGINNLQYLYIVKTWSDVLVNKVEPWLKWLKLVKTDEDKDFKFKDIDSIFDHTKKELSALLIDIQKNIQSKPQDEWTKKYYQLDALWSQKLIPLQDTANDHKKLEQLIKINAVIEETNQQKDCANNFDQQQYHLSLLGSHDIEKICYAIDNID